jgi:hypothetical protein
MTALILVLLPVTSESPPPSGNFLITDDGNPVVIDTTEDNIVLDTAPAGNYIIQNGDYVIQNGDKILAPGA